MNISSEESIKIVDDTMKIFNNFPKILKAYEELLEFNKTGLIDFDKHGFKTDKDVQIYFQNILDEVKGV